MTRSEAIAAVSCPRCGAVVGSKCQQGGVVLDYRICPARKAAAETIDWMHPVSVHPYVRATKNRRNSGLPRR